MVVPEPSEFELLKRVIKELLFKGASRSAKGRFILSTVDQSMSSDMQDLTPLELLVQFREVLPPREFAVLSSFLVLINC